MGWIVLRRAGRDDPGSGIEDWPYALEQPIGPAFAAELRAGRRSSATLTDAERARRCAGGSPTTWSRRPRAARVRPTREHLVFRQQRGFRRAVELDTALGGVLGACDGELPLDRLIDAVAGLLDVDAAALDRRGRAADPGAVRGRIRCTRLSVRLEYIPTSREPGGVGGSTA